MLITVRDNKKRVTEKVKFGFLITSISPKCEINFASAAFAAAAAIAKASNKKA